MYFEFENIILPVFKQSLNGHLNTRNSQHFSWMLNFAIGICCLHPYNIINMYKNNNTVFKLKERN